MADFGQNKYGPPAGPPPGYPQQPPQAMHYDAGPANQWQQPQGQSQQQGPYGGPDQYGQQQNGYYGPPQGMQYGQQQQGMPPQGYYVDNRKGPGAGQGCCAAFLGALACCCCLDLLF